jgi:integrase
MNLTPPARELVNLIRRHNLNYNTLRNAAHAARKYLKLHPPKAKKLPKLIPDAKLQEYMAAVGNSGNLKHEILIKLLFYTGVRNAELCSVQLDDVDLDSCRIFIRDGKGGKDRYVLFSDKFRSLLRAYINTLPDGALYLFESAYRRPYTTRRIHQIVAGYGKSIGIEVHPHLFRHTLLTYLKRSGLDDAQVQLISGHSSRKSLEVYTHLSLSDVHSDYQESLRKVDLP